MSCRYFTAMTTIAALLVGSTAEPACGQATRAWGSFWDLAEALDQSFARRSVAAGVPSDRGPLPSLAVAEAARGNALGRRPDGPLA